MTESPKVGKESQVELGDTMLIKGTIYSYPGLQLLEDIKLTRMGASSELKAGIFKATLEDDRWTFFRSPTPWQNVGAFGKTTLLDGGLMVNKSDPSKLRCWLVQNGTLLRGVEVTAKTVPHAVTEPLVNSFQQELIYNGRVGNAVKFLYREVSAQYLRSSFTQDVQYDLSEGNMIGFKGARIEIIDANNRNLRYRVTEHFP